MSASTMTRRTFAKRTLGAASATLMAPRTAFSIVRQPALSDEVIGHGDFRYDGALYVHQFSFQQTVDLTYEDTVGPLELDVAFRNIDLTIFPTLGLTVPDPFVPTDAASATESALDLDDDPDA